MGKTITPAKWKTWGQNKDSYRLSKMDLIKWDEIMKFWDGGGQPPAPPESPPGPPGGHGGVPTWAKYFITFQLGFLAANFVPLLPSWVGISMFIGLGVYVLWAAKRRWR